MIISVFLLLLVVVIFAVQNSQVVAISFLSWSFSTVQALVILISLFLGVLIGWVWAWLKGGKSRAHLRQVKKELEEAQQRLAQAGGKESHEPVEALFLPSEPPLE